MAVDDAYDDITLDEDDELVGVQGGGGGGWLAAVGLLGTSGQATANSTTTSSSLNTAAMAAMQAQRSSGGGGYMLVDHGTGPTLAHRARVLRRLLLWRNPGASVKALALGLYVIMLLSNIPRALHYMQVCAMGLGMKSVGRFCMVGV